MYINDTPFQNNFFGALNLDTEKQEVKVMDFTLFHNYLWDDTKSIKLAYGARFLKYLYNGTHRIVTFALINRCNPAAPVHGKK